MVRRSRQPVEVATHYDLHTKQHIPIMLDRQTQTFYAKLPDTRVNERPSADATYAGCVAKLRERLEPVEAATWTPFLRVTFTNEGLPQLSKIEMARYAGGWRLRKPGGVASTTFVLRPEVTLPGAGIGGPYDDKACYLPYTQAIENDLTRLMERLAYVLNAINLGIVEVAAGGSTGGDNWDRVGLISRELLALKRALEG